MQNRFAAVAALITVFSTTTYCQTRHAVYPPLADGQRVYVIPADEAQGLIIDTLYLPKDVTLRAGPGVSEIIWTVSHMKIEPNTTFDLSAPTEKPKRGADGAPPNPPQADYHREGSRGNPGMPGARGSAGTRLSIRDVQDIDNQGALWIKTDGGPGGDGGDGGKGQQGGGHTNLHHAADGGPGGSAGRGGDGGAVGTVSISFKGGTNVPTSNGISKTCGSTTRPGAANENTGVIVIYGAPGCRGANGKDGVQGIRG